MHLLIYAAKIDENYTEKEEEIIKKTLLELGAIKKQYLKLLKMQNLLKKIQIKF